MQKKAYVNYVLIAVNVVIFLIVEVTGGTENTSHMINCGAVYTPLVQQGAYYRLFTSMFLHFGIEHLLGNMVLLFAAGEYVERYFGHFRYALLYLGGGFFASWFGWQHTLRIGEVAAEAGASGAIFAVIGGLLILMLLHRGKLENMTIQRLLFMIAVSLYTGFRTPNVGAYAHLGGFLAGTAIAALFVPTLRLSGLREE